MLLQLRVCSPHPQHPILFDTNSSFFDKNWKEVAQIESFLESLTILFHVKGKAVYAICFPKERKKESYLFS